MILILERLKKITLTPAQYISLGFLIIILVGGFILYLPWSYTSEQGPSVIDSIFTAASAVCVTGLVVVDTATTWSTFGQLWILFLIQIGGIGFVTILTSLALAFGKKISLSNKVLATESLSQNNLNDIVSIVKKVTLTTLIIEFIGALALSIYFIPRYGLTKGILFSVFHSISAFCNAGFDLMGGESGQFSSLTLFYDNTYINIIICSLIVLGGLGFITISEVLEKKSFKKLSLHSKIVLLTTLSLILIGSALIFILEYSNTSTLGDLTFKDKILISIFQSITIRTAGFNTIDLSAMNISTLVILIVLMTIGASPASTGGGIKTTTFFICFLFVKDTILNNNEHNVFKKKIPNYIVNKALTALIIAIGAISIFLIILTTLEPSLSLEQATFEIVSALATVGLSLGITPILSAPSKILLILIMFLGRVGSITVLIALLSKLQQNRAKCKIQYIEENVLI